MSNIRRVWTVLCTWLHARSSAASEALAVSVVQPELEHIWVEPEPVWTAAREPSRAEIEFQLTGEVCANCGALRIYLGPLPGWRYLRGATSKCEAAK